MSVLYPFLYIPSWNTIASFSEANKYSATILASSFAITLNTRVIPQSRQTFLGYR